MGALPGDGTDWRGVACAEYYEKLPAKVGSVLSAEQYERVKELGLLVDKDDQVRCKFDHIMAVFASVVSNVLYVLSKVDHCGRTCWLFLPSVWAGLVFVDAKADRLL